MYFGEVNLEGMEAVNRYEHKMILRFCGGICVLMLIFAKQIVQLYLSEDSEVFKMAVFAIRMSAVRIPLYTLLGSRAKYLQAIHKKRNMNLLILVQCFAHTLIAAFVLGKFFGCYGILCCYTVGDAASTLAVYLYYAIKCRKWLPTRMDYLNLPDYFQLAPGDVISLDIRSMEDVALVSEQLMLFCRGHGIDRKTAYYASLSFEELSTNIVKHGFPQNRSSQPIIDMRAVITNGALALRLRDNCPQYDITKQIAAVNAPGSDPVHNIGTRIVSGLASEIAYFNTFDTNSLLIQFDTSKEPIQTSA